jgi:hypothetical protein
MEFSVTDTVDGDVAGVECVSAMSPAHAIAWWLMKHRGARPTRENTFMFEGVDHVVLASALDDAEVESTSVEDSCAEEGCTERFRRIEW